MKKLVFLFVAFAAVSFASCGNKAANTEATEDTTAVVEEVAVVVENDSCCGDSACCADSAACCSEKTAE